MSSRPLRGSLSRLGARVAAIAGGVLTLGAAVGGLAAAFDLELPAPIVDAWRAVAPILLDLAG